MLPKFFELKWGCFKSIGIIFPFTNLSRFRFKKSWRTTSQFSSQERMEGWFPRNATTESFEGSILLELKWFETSDFTIVRCCGCPETWRDRYAGGSVAVTNSAPYKPHCLLGVFVDLTERLCSAGSSSQHTVGTLQRYQSVPPPLLFTVVTFLPSTEL